MPRRGVALEEEDGTRKPKASAGATSLPRNSTLTTATDTKGIRDRCDEISGQCARHISAEAKAGAVRNTEARIFPFQLFTWFQEYTGLKKVHNLTSLTCEYDEVFILNSCTSTLQSKISGKTQGL